MSKDFQSNTPSAPPPSYGDVTGQPTAPPPAQLAYGGYGTGPGTGYDQPAGGYGQPAGGYTTGQPTGYGQPMGGAYNWGAPTNTDPAPAEPSDHYISDSPTFGGSFSDKAIRRGFIRKVYLILMVQLSVTFGFAALFSLVDPIRMWVRSPGGAWFYYASYATFLVTYFVLVCIPSVRRKTPGNYICLTVFTLVFSYMVGTISSFYDTYSVLIAAAITALVCLSISLFAIQTKIDFTMCSGLLFVLVIVLFFFGWSCLIINFTLGGSYILHCVWAGLAALVFSMFLVYDTQMIVGGRKHELSPEEYIYGALQLYIDVVYLFLIILSLFGKSN